MLSLACLVKSLFKRSYPIVRRAASIFLFLSSAFQFLSFSRAVQKERGHRCHSHSPWLLSSLSNFHPPIFSRVPKRVSVITALRMDNSPVYSLLKFALLSGVVSDNREERQAFLSPRLSKRDFLFFFPQRVFIFFYLLCAFVVCMVLCEDNGFRQCLLFKRNRTAYDHVISKTKKKKAVLTARANRQLSAVNLAAYIMHIVTLEACFHGVIVLYLGRYHTGIRRKEKPGQRLLSDWLFLRTLMWLLATF